jgi:N-acetylglucosamine-6-phosphate deacetylase
MTTRFVAGAALLTAGRRLDGWGLLIEDEEIAALRPRDEAPAGVARVDLPDALIAPGFLDLQVNGAGGALFNADPTAETARALARAMRPFGVTGLLPTFITDDLERTFAAAEAALEAASAAGDGVLGVHLEGPFLSPERRGTHDPRFLRVPDDQEIGRLCATAERFARAGATMMITLAPEIVPLDAVERLSRAGAIVSIGHTAALFDEAMRAVAAGARCFTHLSNAMPAPANREPGAVLAGLEADEAWCGVIADGVHVHPAWLRAMSRAKPRGKMFLVSDAMPPTGTDMTEFSLYGRRVLRRGGRLVNEEGALAGADVDLATSVRLCVERLGLSVEEATAMASAYPADLIGARRRGRFAPGARADFVALDARLRPFGTWIGGEWAA